MVRREWFLEIDAIQREMERFLDRFVGMKPPSIRFSPAGWEPPVDVYETDEAVFVIVELPGVREEDFEIILDRNILLIRGERRDERVEGMVSYYQMEIARGPFEREILLPSNVDPDGVMATYERGLLKIRLPKVKEERTYRVRIRVK